MNRPRNRGLGDARLAVMKAVCAGYLEGRTIYEVAAASDISTTTVRHMLREAGVPMRRKGHAYRARHERLWDHVVPEPNLGCWLWLGAELGRGGHFYGVVRWGGRTFAAHRMAWEATNGPIPPELVVRHKCDVTLCINPGHLCLGTPADNSADMVRRGRSLRGARNPQHKAYAQGRA